MMEIRLKVTSLELQLSCLCLLAGIILGQGNEPVVVKVKEGDDAVLPCSLSTKQNIIRKVIDWKKVGQTDEKQVFLYDAGIVYNNGPPDQDEQFKGRVFHFPEQLKSGDASIKIRNTKMSDRGNYTCGFPNLQPQQTFHIELVVGACPKPVITILKQTKDGALLQCEVLSAFPRPKVEWQDSSGNNLTAKEPQVTEREGSYDIILQTTVTKTDNFSCVVTQEEICHKLSTNISVHITEPVVIKVKEGDDAVLPCSLSTMQNIKQELFDWRKVDQKNQEVFEYNKGNIYSNDSSRQDEQFRGRVFHFHDQLEFGNASIKIVNTKVSDSGNYTCDFPRLQPQQTFYIKLDVGTCPKPSVTSLEATQYWELLYCEVLGASPKPEVKWQDSAGNNLPDVKTQVPKKEGRYDITLQTNVTKTGRYYCVATQLNICHQLSTNISVHIPGTCPELHIIPPKDIKDWSLLQCSVRSASPKPEVQWRDSAGHNLTAEERQVPNSDIIILETTVTKTDNFTCVVTQEGICNEISKEIFVNIREPAVVKVVEGSDAVLPCSLSTKQNITGELFNWKKVDQKSGKQKEVFMLDSGIPFKNGPPGQDEQFKQRISHFSEQLEFGNASIVIKDTKMSDGGNYTCSFPYLQPNSPIFHIELVVDKRTPKDSSTGWIVAAVFGILLVVGVLAVLYDKRDMIQKFMRGSGSSQSNGMPEETPMTISSRD